MTPYRNPFFHILGILLGRELIGLEDSRLTAESIPSGESWASQMVAMYGTVLSLIRQTEMQHQKVQNVIRQGQNPETGISPT
jgi:hypothetical protein